MKHHALATYFALAYVISWVVWAPAVLASVGWISPLPTTRYLHLLGGIGPMLAALIVSAALGGVPAIVALARRCVRGGPWLAVAVAIPGVAFFVALALIAVVSGDMPDWSRFGRNAELPELPPFASVLANLVCYGFGEEIGWRGFALPRLQARHSALRSSLLLALAWAGWHLPLFSFAAGFSHLGAGGAAGWLVSLTLGSTLLTWLFNSSGGSIGAVALLHASLDVFTTSRVVDDPLLPNLIGAALSIAALLVLRAYGAEHLARRDRLVTLQEPGSLRSHQRQSQRDVHAEAGGRSPQRGGH